MSRTFTTTATTQPAQPRAPKTDGNGNGHAQAQATPYTWNLLPRELRERGSFVLYRNQDGKKKPFRPANPAKLASSSDSATWATFKLTQAAYTSYPGFDGINAVCSPDFTFIDLDDCINDNHISDRARRIVAALPETYWEASPSGTGLHGVFHSKGGVYLPKCEDSIVEAYSEKHFMSCTGWALNDRARIGTLQPRHVKLLRAAQKTAPTTSKSAAPSAGPSAPLGGRHQALLRVAGSLARNGSSPAAVERALREYNTEQCQPPLEEKEILLLLRSVGKYKAVGSLLVQETRDIGNADRLLLFGQGDFCYMAAYKRWAGYDGTHWAVEDREQEDIRVAAHMVVRAYGVQAAEAQDEKHMKFAAACGDSTRITNMMREAQPQATLRIAQLDTDTRLVNFLNGTLDARTMRLRPQRREDYITAVIPHNYNPKAQCPRFLKFLQATFGGDKALIAFVQRALGYSLTGDTSEKCMLLAYGPTDTGKTTLLTTAASVMGAGYAGGIKVESLMVDRGRAMDNNAQADLADLRGKRYVNTSETGQGQQLRESLVKLLAQGQGSYRAVRKYENPFEFPETWKIWMDCNHLPGVRDTDDAIWQRLHVIPFQHAVADKDKNRHLGAELVAEEAEGILAWMVEGLKAWMKNGLQVPATVTQQRQEWRAESDVLSQWLEECCVVRGDASAASLMLYTSYKDWREQHGLFPESTVMFARSMKAHGFEKKEVGDAKVPHWLRVGIKVAT